MAPHSSTLAWKIPWTEEPGRLQSMVSLRVGHDSATSLSLFTFLHWRRKWQPAPVFLPGESQGRGSLVGCHLWGCTESDTTEATQQQQQQQQFVTPDSSKSETFHCAPSKVLLSQCKRRLMPCHNDINSSNTNIFIDKAGNISKIADNAVNYDQLGSRSPKAFKFNFFLHATETGIQSSCHLT